MHENIWDMENGHARWGKGGEEGKWEELCGRWTFLVIRAFCLERALR